MPKPASLENYTESQIASLAALANDLQKDPATRKDFLRLTKKKYPTQPIPELDVDDQVVAATKPLQESVASLEKKFIESEAERNVLRKRQDLYDEGFSKEDVTAIEKVMMDEKIPSHETAAKYFKATRQTATPTPSTITPMTLPVDKKTIKDSGGIKKWALGEAFKAADEIKTGRVKLH